MELLTVASTKRPTRCLLRALQVEDGTFKMILSEATIDIERAGPNCVPMQRV